MSDGECKKGELLPSWLSSSDPEEGVGVFVGSLRLEAPFLGGAVALGVLVVVVVGVAFLVAMGTVFLMDLGGI